MSSHQEQRFALFSIVIVAVANGHAVAQTWEAAPELPTAGPRIDAAGVNQNGTLYAIGGTPWQNGGDMDGSVHQLPPGATSWNNVAPLGGMGPVISLGAGVDALDRIVVFGGFILNDDGAGQDVVYEPIDGPTGGVASRPSPQEATGYMAFAIDDQHRLYGIGGGPGAGGPNSAYVDRYDGTTDSWQVLAPLLLGIADACAALDGNGHILVCGGIDANGAARTANVARYDIAADAWSDTAIPDLPVALSGAEAALGADGRIYVAGGETGPLGAGTTQSATYKWEPAINQWVIASAMMTPRKSFAFVLGDDDYLYAIGGDNDGGGTHLVERLFTPRCPAFDRQPADQSAWSGSVAGFSVSVSGAAPFTYEWRRGGQLLTDGPTGNGSTISGADGEALTILNPTAADEATYDVVVTNACGSSVSNAANLTVRQTPTIPTTWNVINLHPAWAQESSTANGISGGRIGGEATTPTLLPDGRTLSLSHPVVWASVDAPGLDITPAGSVGGGIRDAAGDLMVGWFWHTYTCPPPVGGTCGWQSAAYWTGDALAFTEALHSSGPEYDIAVGTDGFGVAGTLTYEFTEGTYQSRATLWIPPGSAINLHNADLASQSAASAVDGDLQFGSYSNISSGISTRAARWSGNAASMTDIHPDGFVRSWVSGAADGHAVGTAVLGATNHAILWAGGSAQVDLTPDGMAAEAVDAHGGLQVGNVGGYAAIWAGNAGSWFDLSSVLPPEYGSGRADAIEVDAEGKIVVVGSAYVPARTRSEAIVWVSGAAVTPGDANCDGFVDLDDISPFTGVLLSTDPASCHVAASDMNGDGEPDGLDIAIFVNAVLGL